MDEGLDLRRRQLEALRHLLVGQAAHRPHDQGLSMVLGQLRENGLDLGALHAALDLRIGVARHGRVGRPHELPALRELLGRLGAPRLGPQGVEADVRRDTRDPRLEQIPAVEPGKALEDLQHGLLRGLLRVRGVLGEDEDQGTVLRSVNHTIESRATRFIK